MQITLEWYKYKQYRNGRSKLQMNLHILILQMYSIVFKQQVLPLCIIRLHESRHVELRQQSASLFT